MDLAKLSEPLPISEIDFRIQSINKGGYATILAYKSARVDMDRLDSVCGPMGWKREHSRDNKNCIVSIFDEQRGHWVSKEDTGTEGNIEAEKGLASDSFKRACFNWGIGRELYDYPLIQVKLNQNEFKVLPAQGSQKERVVQTWDLRLNEWLWYSEFEGNKITFLAARDQLGVRFKWGKRRGKENG